MRCASLIIVRNDQKTFFQTQGVLATGDLACAPGHSVYMPLYRWDVTPVHQRKVESGAVFCESAIERSEGPSPSPWNSQPQQPWLEDQRHFRRVKWAGGLKKAVGFLRLEDQNRFQGLGACTHTQAWLEIPNVCSFIRKMKTIFSCNISGHWGPDYHLGDPRHRARVSWFIHGSLHDQWGAASISRRGKSHLVLRRPWWKWLQTSNTYFNGIPNPKWAAPLSRHWNPTKCPGDYDECGYKHRMTESQIL